MTRLIDADALLEAMNNFYTDEYFISAKAVKDVITNATTVQRDGWISVEDRLPEYGQEVIVYRIRSQRMKHDTVSSDYRSMSGQQSRNMWMQTRGDESITHWQPLPDSPTTSETNTEVRE